MEWHSASRQMARLVIGRISSRAICSFWAGLAEGIMTYWLWDRVIRSQPKTWHYQLLSIISTVPPHPTSIDQLMQCQLIQTKPSFCQTWLRTWFSFIDLPWCSKPKQTRVRLTYSGVVYIGIISETWEEMQLISYRIVMTHFAFQFCTFSL